MTHKYNPTTLSAHPGYLRPFDAELIAAELPALLDGLRCCSFTAKEPASPKKLVDAAYVSNLADWLAKLKAPIEAVEVAGIMGNPWSAAGLDRDEVRNASVLAWFLNPQERHGFRDALLVEILEHVGQSRADGFPSRPTRQCRVSPEECPDGDQASRVDIQIDDQGFFLVVEVKIGAPEQPDQLRRYCEAAAARTLGMRPWSVVFLTPDGRPPLTAGDQADRVLPLSWTSVAAAFRRVAHRAAPVPRFLANAFAAHISNF
jgi:hypothetical protein